MRRKGSEWRRRFCQSSRPNQQLFDDCSIRQGDGEQSAFRDIVGGEHALAGLGGGRSGAALEEWGVYIAWVNCASSDAVDAFFGVDGHGQAADGEFGGDVGGAGF